MSGTGTGIGPGPMVPVPDQGTMDATEDISQAPTKSNILREPPDPPEQRRLLVGRWQDRIHKARDLQRHAHKRMRDNMDFAFGRQWPGQNIGRDDPRYVANIALRHVQQRTATLYASNPKVVARKRKRLLATVWDGDMLTLATAQQQMQQAAQMEQLTGMPAPPNQNAAAIVADFKNVQSYDKMLSRVCDTLEILYNYEIDQQVFPFKTMMKMTIRRAIVTGVGFVKLGFQRKLKMRPEMETRIADMSERLANIERLAADLADDEVQQESAEAEELRLAIAALQQEPKLILREGLIFDYPDSTAIIVDPKTRSLHGFLGADWVAQEYYLSVDDIQEIYNVDVGYGYRAYARDDVTSLGSDGMANFRNPNPTIPGLLPDGGISLACVWEIYSRKDGIVYVVCDGYKDFLQEPVAPDVYNDDFWPWYPIILNETYHEREVFPKSDIDLLKDMQLELNRARQGLREHRRANRPKIAVAAGILEEEDKDKLRNHPANALLELNALSPGQKIEDVLQPIKMPAIDPALYETSSTFEDLLRVLGQDQASMGDSQDVTATESAVADASRHTDLRSVIDDQDDLLTQIAQAAGKILMLNVSAQTVQEVVGPGAVWPELTKEDVAKNIYLEVKAGSTGRPNRQQEIQAAQIIFPMLQRIPGISPEWMARELLRRLDDRMDLTDAFIAGMPSMDAINRQPGGVAAPEPEDPTNPVTASGQLQPGQIAPPPGAQLPGGGGAPGMPVAPPMAGGPNDPTAQGAMGAQNAPAINPINGRLGPRTPPVPGANGMMPGRGGGPRLTPGQGQPTP